MTLDLPLRIRSRHTADIATLRRDLDDALDALANVWTADVETRLTVMQAAIETLLRTQRDLAVIIEQERSARQALTGRMNGSDLR